MEENYRRRPPQKKNVRRPARKQQKRRRRIHPAGIIVAVFSVAALCYCGYMFKTLGVGEQHFYDGISVLGVDLSGMTYEQGEAAVKAVEDAWESRTFTISYQEQTWQVTASDFGADLDPSDLIVQAWNIGHAGNVFEREAQINELKNNPVDLTCDPTYDAESIAVYAESMREDIDTEPVNAEIAVTEDKPEVITRSVVGYSLDTAALVTDLTELVLNGSNNDSMVLTVETVKPAIDSGSAESGLQLVVDWTTDLSNSSKKRNVNVNNALSKFNGMVLYPGQTISFNSVVGKRTVENGFVEAPEYSGTTIQMGIGGGTCQASSTLYGAILQLGLKVKERHHHKMTVSYTPASLDAAVSDNADQDLVFTNNTDIVYYFYTSTTSKVARVQVYGVKLPYRVELVSEIVEDGIKAKTVNYEEDTSGKYAYYTDQTKLKSKGKDGRKSTCTRVFYDWNTGEEVKREKVSTDVYYAMPDTYYIGIHERE